VLPLLYAFKESLYQERRNGLLGAPHTIFVWFGNFLDALRDSQFTGAIGRMALFGIVEIPLLLLFSLVLALLLDSGSARFKKLFRAIYFVPNGVPGVVATLLWGFLYTPGISPVVRGLDAMGLHANFFGPSMTLVSIGNILIWTAAGYNMLVLTAQLQSIPQELYEAAKADGANAWHVAWHIKIPLLRPALVLVTIFGIIGTLQLFAEPQVLAVNDPSITNQYTPNLSAFSQAFDNNNYGTAAAQSIIIAAIALVTSFVFLTITQRRRAR
jgi:multiple sugar transport system permease protein